MAVVCLFITNDIIWADSFFSSSSSSSKATLAPNTQLTEPEFRELFKAREFLLSHEAANKYIKEQIEKEIRIWGKEKWENDKTMQWNTRMGGAGQKAKSLRILPTIKIVSVAGLLRHTGQFAHVGLSGKDYNNMPVVYVDSQFYNEQSPFGFALHKHEADEIAQWENLRLNILSDKYGHEIGRSQMRRWIKDYIDSADEKLKGTPYESLNSRQIAKKFHKDSYLLDSLYAEYADKTDFDYEYINTMLSLYGTDEESKDVNIAAKQEEPAAGMPVGIMEKIRKLVSSLRSEIFVYTTPSGQNTDFEASTIRVVEGFVLIPERMRDTMIIDNDTAARLFYEQLRDELRQLLIRSGHFKGNGPISPTILFSDASDRYIHGLGFVINNQYGAYFGIAACKMTINMADKTLGKVNGNLEEIAPGSLDEFVNSMTEQCLDELLSIANRSTFAEDVKVKEYEEISPDRIAHALSNVQYKRGPMEYGSEGVVFSSLLDIHSSLTVPFSEYFHHLDPYFAWQRDKKIVEIQSNRRQSRVPGCSGGCPECFADHGASSQELESTEPLDLKRIPDLLNEASKLGAAEAFLVGEDTFDDLQSLYQIAAQPVFQSFGMKLNVYTGSPFLLTLDRQARCEIFKNLKAARLCLTLSWDWRHVSRWYREGRLEKLGIHSEAELRHIVLKRIGEMFVDFVVSRPEGSFDKPQRSLLGHEEDRRNQVSEIVLFVHDNSLQFANDVIMTGKRFAPILAIHVAKNGISYETDRSVNYHLSAITPLRTASSLFQRFKGSSKRQLLEDKCSFVCFLDFSTSRFYPCSMRREYWAGGVSLNHGGIWDNVQVLLRSPRFRHVVFGTREELFHQMGFALALYPELKEQKVTGYKHFESKIFRNKGLMMDIEMMFLLYDILRDGETPYFDIDSPSEELFDVLTNERYIQAMWRYIIESQDPLLSRFDSIRALRSRVNYKRILSNGKLPYRVPEQLRFPAIIRQTATDTTLTSQNLPDIKNLQDALNKLIDFDKKNQDELCSYTVRYDEDKIPKESLAHQLLETYVKKLSEQLDGKDRIKLKGAKLKDNNIISVECQTRSGKVIGQASVGITEDVSGKAMRLIGMLNIAFIASQIPKGISQQEASSYDNLISLIKTQYKDICDEDLIVDLLKDTASGIHIRLPRVAPVPLDKVDEYYRLTIIQLKKAA